MKKKRVIIGLAGFPGAGKTTAARYMEEKGFGIITLSDFIKKEVKKKNLPPTRMVLQNYGNRMRKKYGPQILAQLAVKKIESESLSRAVIDGIRNKYEVKFLEVENGFFFIGVKADAKIRYKRVLKKRGAKKVGSYKEFCKHEAREDSLGSSEVGLRVKDCLSMAKYSVVNNGEKQTLYDQLDGVIQKVTS